MSGYCPDCGNTECLCDEIKAENYPVHTKKEYVMIHKTIAQIAVIILLPISLLLLLLSLFGIVIMAIGMSFDSIGEGLSSLSTKWSDVMDMFRPFTNDKKVKNK
jgi:hypothetical protein